MRVLLVTSWGTAGCGIEEHSRYLIDSVGKADSGIEMSASARWLDPEALFVDLSKEPYDTQTVVHLNYQAALHSRWHPEIIRRLRTGSAYATQGRHYPVSVTYHDSGVPNSDQCKGVVAACDAAVIHEPFDDLPPEKTRYWRMGVPAPATTPYWFGARDEWPGDSQAKVALYFKAYRQQPVVGTIGFPFGWKNQVELARVAASVGWGFCCICPTASLDYVAELTTANPDLYVRTDFVPSDEALRILSGCDATAFPYVTNNAGQSGAILQGIAARKPVIAFWTCRQFRSLMYNDFYGNQFSPDFLGPQVWLNDEHRSHAIRWCETFDEIAITLSRLPIGTVDAPTVALAHRESWEQVGQRYARLFRSLVT